jgi:hypothetical protein
MKRARVPFLSDNSSIALSHIRIETRSIAGRLTLFARVKLTRVKGMGHSGACIQSESGAWELLEAHWCGPSNGIRRFLWFTKRYQGDSSELLVVLACCGKPTQHERIQIRLPVITERGELFPLEITFQYPPATLAS